jgi:nicotinamide mononucleotide transporter
MAEWFTAHIIEIFGAVTGIIYVFLEIKQNIWLWPVGIVTSATYIYVFRVNGFYADMLLQVYYLVISIYGWWAWKHGKPQENANRTDLRIMRIDMRTTLWTSAATVAIFGTMWYVLDNWTDSPVPLWDAVITTLSIIATWMLTRKILEQWHVWIVANAIAIIVYVIKGMYPTVILFIVYFVMAIAGLLEWRRDYYACTPVNGQCPVSPQTDKNE